MEIQATKAYFDFIESASFIFDELLSPKKRTIYEIDQIKETFSIEAFENVSREFILEVKTNIDQYESHALVWDSLKIYHGKYLEEYKDDYSNTQIHQANFEIGFMTGLWTNIRRSHTAIGELMTVIVDTRPIIFQMTDPRKYPFLEKLRSGEIVSYFSSKCKLIKDPEIKIPDKDPRFNFIQLQKDIEQLQDPFDQIALIKKRLAEFRIWTSMYDMKPGAEEFYTRKYYPNFYNSCNIELDRIEEVLKIQLRKAEFEKLKAAPLIAQPLQKLQWTKSSKDFVETFYKLIVNKKIALNGNSDIDPIVRILHDTFDIPKGKGAGFLSEHSLQTYFRKEHSGDVW